MKEITPDRICFGLDPELDKASFCCFLRLVGGEQFSKTLAERIAADEMNDFIDHVYRLLKKNLSENEYHTIFLQEARKKSHQA